ncbi:MAG TPA: MOSC domain-containing protein [Burkholderiales bacterium]|nr:MOSC domain-containing protein [Burkholderiales bacterium]
MPKVAALYRYPVKGFAPETCDTLTMLPEGRIAGDRVLGLRFANCAAADEVWSTKHEMVALVNTPGLARFDLRLDHRALRLRLRFDGAAVIEAPLDEAGRERIATALADQVLRLDENPLSGHPERLPLRLVGDGRTPRYQDNAAGQITLHGRESLQAVARTVDDPALSEVRFRSNIAVEGLEAWEEQQWIGRKIRIGTVELQVVTPKTRCLATHANPLTGKRDIAMMPALLQCYVQERPTFAVALMPTRGGGEIHIGDSIEVLA